MAFHPKQTGARLLIADDEASLRKVLSASLRKAGFDVVAAKDGQEALELLLAAQKKSSDAFDVVIADVRMPRMDGMELLSAMRTRGIDVPAVMLTAHGTVDMAVTALKEGAFDFLTKPYERDEVLRVVKKAIGQQAAHLKDASPQTDETGHPTLVGTSERMRRVHDIIARVAATPSTVLITGESGTGKELVARALHDQSPRAKKPFISINCAAIPETLIESELFGYEKGAFTGAVSSKPGRFELADGGTLFLDEIGDLPVEMQVKLLRALQESRFERVGGIKTLEVDVRLVAATNRDLQAAIADGSFREDLYYRLNVVPVQLPPLRERTEDVAPLVEHFRAKFNTRLDRAVERFTEDALGILRAYPWPGNIRELENIIERTMLFCDAADVTVDDLPPDLVAQVDGAPRSGLLEGLPALVTMDEDASMRDIVRQATAGLERELIARALENTDGNVTHAARRLKISRKSLQLKMKEFGLRDEPQGATERAD